MSSPNTKRNKLGSALAIAAAIICVALGVVVITRPATPRGGYDTSIVGHGSADVRLVFSEGTVTLEGDEGLPDQLGTYFRTEKGEWLWSSEKTKWRLEPHWLGLRCVEMADTNNVFFLKRKFRFLHREGVF